MTIDELRTQLTYLAEKYVHDEAIRASLLDLIKRDVVPAKGILADMHPFLSGKISTDDGDIVQEIAYWFC